MNQQHNIEKYIESILFVAGEPLSLEQLSGVVGCSKEEARTGVESVKDSLKDRGLRIMVKDESVLLVTAPECSDVVQGFKREELSGELTKASLETLAMVVYNGPITRPEIDYVRGVNSTYIVRNLMIRGLIERIPNPKDARSYLYRPSFDLLQFLGVSKLDELPEYSKFKEKLGNFVEQGKEV